GMWSSREMRADCSSVTVNTHLRRRERPNTNVQRERWLTKPFDDANVVRRSGDGGSLVNSEHILSMACERFERRLTRNPPRSGRKLPRFAQKWQHAPRLRPSATT